MTIISHEKHNNAFHLIESQSHRTEVWMDGYIAVPEELTESVMQSLGYCDLILDADGNLTGITPLPKPEPPAPPVDPNVQLRADVDYISMMTGVEL